jgi:hypothetical protein
MKSMTPIIRPMTAADRSAVVPAELSGTLRGYVAELDGKIVGVMGILHTSPPTAIGKMWDELRDHPRTVLQAIKLFREMLQKNYTYVVALADIDEKNSPAVLTRVGFVQRTAATEEHKGVFTWHS